MPSNLRSLSASEAKVVLSLLEDGRSRVEMADIAELTESRGAARKVAQSLARKGWLARTTAGRYMLLPPEYGPENLGENNALALAASIIDPCYVGWWSAASYHGFTTQRPMQILVASLKQLPRREVESSEVRFVKVTPRKFFGWETYDVYGRTVPISTPAKTLVDCVDRPDLAGGAAEVARIVHAGSRVVDGPQLADVAFQLGSSSLLQRLGFLTDVVGAPLQSDVRQALRYRIPKSQRSTFGRRDRVPGDIGYVPEWGLFVHVAPKDLLAEVPQGQAMEGA